MRPARNLSRKIAPAIEGLLRGSDRALARLARTDVAPTDPPRAVEWSINAIAHWRAEGREQYLVETVQALQRQAPRSVSVVITNEPGEVAELLDHTGAPVRTFSTLDGVSAFVLSPEAGVVVAGWPGAGREHGFRLTWSHKRLFRDLVRRQSAFDRGVTHLVYIEDDLALPDGALDYWTAYRSRLEPLALIPGFTRVEGPPHDARLTSPYRPLPLSELPSFGVPGRDGVSDLTFVNLLQPYQGFYVLDRPLAEAHFAWSSFRSERRSMMSAALGGGWGLRERAAAGAIFDGVPQGLRSRNVIPLTTVEGGHLLPLDVCLVRHLPSNYYADPTTKKATVPVGAAFLSS